METRWLDPGELRVGLGCMRLSTGAEIEEEGAAATIRAAVEAGITIFDTAHSYGPRPEDPGHNERLVARVLGQSSARGRARVVTKGGMTRAGNAWIPDGRARTILEDCRASLESLGGLAIDLYLLHVPDPRTPFATSVRALRRLLDEGLVRRVGVANVNRGQLDQALDLADIAAVQVALSPFDDHALRGGVLELCDQRGIAVIAHSPLGGPRRARSLARRVPVNAVMAADATPAEVALAWLLGLSPNVVVIPGARRTASIRSAVRAATLDLSASQRATLDGAFEMPRAAPRQAAVSNQGGDVVLIMGIPGAGKSHLAAAYVERGYLGLNRDERGGSLRDIAVALDAELASGARKVVLDNTYVSRAARSRVVESAARYRLPVRCIWLDTPLAQAQRNLVERMLARTGSLPSPEDLRGMGRRQPGFMLPGSQMRSQRELEPPSLDEGLASIERVPFARRHGGERTGVGVFVGLAAMRRPGWMGAIAAAHPGAPHLVFDWVPGGSAEDLAAAALSLGDVVSGAVEGAVCPHPEGPPTCWCRPPLPGLPLAFAHAHAIDVGQAVLVGTTTAHRTLAATLGARFVEV